MGVDTISRPQVPDLRPGDWALGDWYADPLAYPEALAARQRAHRALQLACTAGGDRFHVHLQAFIADYWLGRSVSATHRSLAISATNESWRALADLAYGQLLMSCKCSGAYDCLESGFTRAAKLFEAREYFRVLKRHTLLRSIVLADKPAPPQGLASLLEGARIISRLANANGTSRNIPWSSEDTVG